MLGGGHDSAQKRRSLVEAPALVLWQFDSATRREGASRSRDSFVKRPGVGIARTRNSHSPNRTIIISVPIFNILTRRDDDF
jgi:hypothetical protein